MAAYEVPSSPDYIPGPEVPPSPDYIPGPEEQPLPATAASPTADSPGYVPESDPEEEPEEDDEDPEEDPADYPADGDDDDDEDEDEDEEEEEEHPALADSVPPVHRMTARISIRDEPSISLPPREEIPSPLLPIPSPPPNSPTHIEIPESCLPLRKRVHFASPTPSREVGESSAAGAARQDRPTIARDDPYSIGVRAIDEIAPSSRPKVNLLFRDRSCHRRFSSNDIEKRLIRWLHEAWGLSMDASDYARSDVMSLRTTVVAQSALISELQSADHRRQRVITELLASDHKRQVQLTKTLRLLKGLQTQMVEFTGAELWDPQMARSHA
ncbi:hypothetical protein Tco_1029418 [Tanacetum coccineum]|uniref:Uncharacterized protein n=1 Tax=Tanacetum coccineum TaxID=301880 RepID=A0ABQ5G5M0_9ASTR